MEEITIERAKKEIRKIGYTLWIKRTATFAVIWSLVLYISYLLVGTHMPMGVHVVVLLIVSVPLFFISLANAYGHWMWADASKIWTYPLNKLTDLRNGYEEIALTYPSYSAEGRGQMVNDRHYFKEYISERNKAVRDASLRNNESLAKLKYGSSGAMSVRPLTRKELCIVWALLFFIGIITCVVGTITGPAA